MPDDFQRFMEAVQSGQIKSAEDTKDFIDDTINRRQERAKKLASRFPELAGLGFPDFIQKIEEAGLALDFVTATAMHEALNGEEEK